MTCGLIYVNPEIDIRLYYYTCVYLSVSLSLRGVHVCAVKVFLFVREFMCV